MLIPMYFIIGIWGGERRLYAVDQVRPLHAGRLAADAGGDPLPLRPATTTATGTWTLRLRRSCSQLMLPRDGAAALLRRLRAGLLHQGAALPAAHLAARRARRGADGRLGDPGRRPAEVRHLRLPALRASRSSRCAVAQAARRCIATLAVIGIVYGALVAYVQDDVKKLVAYSSVSHLGFVVLGLVHVERQGHRRRRSTRCWRTASRRAGSSSASASSTSAATRASSTTSAACGR